MHPIIRSRENGWTGEAISLGKSAKTEFTNKRLEVAYTRDGMRKWGEMVSRARMTPEAVEAVGDALLRFSAFPGTSVMLTGSHGHTPDYEAPGTAQREYEYHHAVLSALGTLPFSDSFAYAMNVETPGRVDPTAKREVEAEVIARLRTRWKDLLFVCSTRNWSNPSDLIGYRLPAENCVARIGFYEPFAVSHWWTPELGLDAPVPYPYKGGIVAKTERGNIELQKAVGFNRLSMEKILRTCLATGTKFLITEAGVFKDNPANGPGDGSADRWDKDITSVCYRLGIPLMKFTLGSVNGTRNYGYGRGIGL